MYYFCVKGFDLVLYIEFNVLYYKVEVMYEMIFVDMQQENIDLGEEQIIEFYIFCNRQVNLCVILKGFLFFIQL